MYKNILREKEFCINFINPDYYEACQKTIKNNGEDADELLDAGFTPENAASIKTPRIKEAFIGFECKLESVSDLSGKRISAMIIGRVVNAAIDENHKYINAVCGEKGFMFYIHAPKDLATGEGEQGAIAQLRTMRFE